MSICLHQSPKHLNGLFTPDAADAQKGLFNMCTWIGLRQFEAGQQVGAILLAASGVGKVGVSCALGLGEACTGDSPPFVPWGGLQRCQFHNLCYSNWEAEKKRELAPT